MLNLITPKVAIMTVKLDFEYTGMLIERRDLHFDCLHPLIQRMQPMVVLYNLRSCNRQNLSVAKRKFKYQLHFGTLSL